MNISFPLLLDGATGTQLQARGFTGSQAAEEWILEHPDAILEIQREYVAAGSRVLYAPTFGANREKLEEHGIFGKVSEYNRRLVELSKKAADGKAWVAADLSPIGRFLPPMGETSFQEFVDIYTEQAAAAAQAGVDLFVFETAMTLAEARAAVIAVKSVSSLPLFVSFTCDAQGKTMSGTDIAAALVVMQGMGVDAFGLNCSAGPREMLENIKRLRPWAQIPLIAKPNAGLPQMVDGKTVYDCPPEEFAAYTAQLARSGVAIFGGCCGTTGAHIAALRDALKDIKIAPPEPKFADFLPCATEKMVFPLAINTPCGEVLRADENLMDALDDANEDERPLICVEIRDEVELEYFADCQYAVSKPLCLKCEDAQLLDKALGIYQGRAVYDGSLATAVLTPLVKKYGLII